MVSEMDIYVFEHTHNGQVQLAAIAVHADFMDQAIRFAMELISALPDSDEDTLQYVGLVNTRF